MAGNTTVEDGARRRFALGRSAALPYIVANCHWNSPGRIICPNATQTSWISADRKAFAHIRVHKFFKSVYILPMPGVLCKRTDDPGFYHHPRRLPQLNTTPPSTTCAPFPLEKISHYHHIDDAHPDIACTEQKDPDRVMLGKGQIDLAAETAAERKRLRPHHEPEHPLQCRPLEQDPLDVISNGLTKMKTLWAEA